MRSDIGKRGIHFLIVTMILIMGFQIVSIQFDINTNSLNVKGEVTSLSGIVKIEDVAGTRIIGPYLDPYGLKLGLYSKILKTDIGYDLIFSMDDPFLHPGIQQRYRQYIIEGDGSRFPEKIVINENTPYTLVSKPNEITVVETYEGDIDGNGYTDIIKGEENYPGLHNPDRPGRITITFRSAERNWTCSFIGMDNKDLLGKDIAVGDINGDGMDDILVGAPESDGLDNSRNGCGEIFVILGKDNRSFPVSASIEQVSDLVLEGCNMKGDGYGDYGGDKIGREFSLIDMDQDGEMEVYIANHAGWIKNQDGSISTRCGWISSYNMKDLISMGKERLILGHPSELLTINAVDEGDCMGWILMERDFDRDGFPDLFITSSYADGDNNSKPMCGEVFIIYGSGYRFRDLKVKGPAVEGDMIFCRSGNSNWNISFLDSNKENDICGVEMEFIQDSQTMKFLIGQNIKAHLFGDMRDVQILSSGFHHNGSGIGYCELDLYFNWSIPFNGETDVKFTLIDDKGDEIYSILEDRIDFRKDLKLTGTPIVTADGIPLEETGGNALPGSEVAVSGLEVIFQGFPDRTPHPGSVSILLEDDEKVRDSFLNGETPILETTARDIFEEKLSISLALPDHLSSGSKPPDLGIARDVRIPLDREAPMKPEMITYDLVMDDPYGKSYNLTMDWEYQIGKNGDNDESGVKYLSAGL